MATLSEVAPTCMSPEVSSGAQGRLGKCRVQSSGRWTGGVLWTEDWELGSAVSRSHFSEVEDALQVTSGGLQAALQLLH